ncbi:MAG: hypothetical protein WCY55_08365 [Anaerovoracaceae bacterium]
MRIADKRGSLLVDAACCIPLFIIAAVLLLCLIIQCGIEETSAHVLAQSARTSVRAAAPADDADRDAVLKSAFWMSFEYRLRQEQERGRPDASLVRISCGECVDLPGIGLRIDNLVRAHAHVRNALPEHAWTLREPVAYKQALFRPFVGESLQDDPEDRTLVYVFPKRGIRYHIRSCSTLREGEISGVLNARIRRSYAPCKLCKPASLPDGAQIHLFSEASRVYHRVDCPTVKKSYVQMQRSEAVSQGYTPCMLCGGGHR